jgi:hypothetical protein
VEAAFLAVASQTCQHFFRNLLNELSDQTGNAGLVLNGLKHVTPEQRRMPKFNGGLTSLPL